MFSVASVIHIYNKVCIKCLQLCCDLIRYVVATETDLNSYIDLAITAIGAGDVTSAMTYAAQAEMVLGALADVQADGVSERYSQSISAIKASIRHAQAAEQRSNRKNKIGRCRTAGV